MNNDEEPSIGFIVALVAVVILLGLLAWVCNP
jgi:hypothetical protein